MSKYYVYSTMSQDVKYSVYGGRADLPVALRSVLIKGGAGVINKRLLTPNGVATEINEEEHAVLMGGDGNKPNELFEKHAKSGFVKVEKKSIKVDKAVKDLEKKDKSAQYEDKDFVGKTNAKVKSVGDA